MVAIRCVSVGLILVAASGCAARKSGFAQRFVRPGQAEADSGGAAPAAPRPDLQEYARKLRELQARATPKTPNLLPTIESRDPALAAALLRVTLLPSAESHRLAAAAYRNAGIRDYAFRHYQRALRLEPCDSAAYEGLAQIWRDWSMPGLALGDAHRAIYCRPDSASAYNTLGTVLEALGQRKPAREAFEFALQLEPTAVYALNNLCFLAVREADGARAQQACERALMLEPGMSAARTNLALAYAVQGNINRAEAQLLDSPDPVEAQYNVGMLRMSVGNYAGAAEAFGRAAAERPSLGDAARRALQARRLAAQKVKQ
jgi:Flp pilus assembly protein TadD